MPQTSRVVLNRAAFAEIDLAIADGLFAVAQRVLEVVKVPDSPLLKELVTTSSGKVRWEHIGGTEPAGKGQGLVQGGGALAYLGGKKVNGTTIGGKQVKKPRALNTRDGQAVAIVGFGFPARFVELGTVHTHAEPFLTPAVMAVAGSEAEVLISEATKRRLAGFRDAKAAARFGPTGTKASGG